MAGVNSIMMMNSNAVARCMDYETATTSTTGDDTIIFVLDDVLNAEFNNISVRIQTN